ncbi:MAG: FAD-binding oxidoreductase [Deltaproteobacteria bacterium]|nr:FAD-binding oxidoreductase [Deltaproteobacteria bacterium]
MERTPDTSAPWDVLRARLGEKQVLTDEETRVLYSTDFSEEHRPAAAAILLPGSTEEVSEAVKLATSAGYAVIPRGGGMTYTRGFVPEREQSVILDLGRLNRVLAVDTEDLFVSVEAGVTWKQLREALRGKGYRVPFMGTLSGVRATVGGGLGNNATGVGRGDITDHLLGLEVVAYDGRVIQTGALATGSATPLHRYFGPDLTGLFVHDGGALGIKTRAAFRLVKNPGGTAYSSFGFRDRHSMVSALVAIAKLGVHSEMFAFERYHHDQFATQPKPSAAEAKALLREIVSSSPSRFRGLVNVLRTVRPGGLKYLSAWDFSLNIVIDAFDHASAERAMAAARKLARRHGGTRLPAALSIALRADPFMPVDRLIVGMKGANSFPSNGNVPLSRAHEFISALESFFAENAAVMKEHGIEKTIICVSPHGLFGVEPILYWHDRMNPLRASILTGEQRTEYGKIPPNSAATEAAIRLRHGLRDLFERLGCIHYGIGKYYPYRSAVKNEDNWRTLQELKHLLDPSHLGNPGALGLD